MGVFPMNKKCSACGLFKPIDNFYKNSFGIPRSQCKVCHAMGVKRSRKPFTYSYEQYRKNKEKYPITTMFHYAKQSAIKKGLTFSLTKKDIVIPKKCPIYDIPLFFTRGKRADNTPSLDRINNSLGYIPGNVKVISWRANQIKRDATINEIENLLVYMRGA
jgi:hypothetical protein